MYELIVAGGWMMLPLLVCSLVVVTVVGERCWSLSKARIAPPDLLGKIWGWLQQGQLDSKKIQAVNASSPLGEVLAQGLSNTRHGREVMIETMEVAANRVQHELERYLSALSTIATIAPLMGLLGTVTGMIKIFSAIMMEGGTGNPGALAGGISEALITTAAGLVVAIPAALAARYFYRRVDGYMVGIQRDAMKLVDALHTGRAVRHGKAE